jgi:hypothetical protein
MVTHSRFPALNAVLELQDLVHARERDLAQQLQSSPRFNRLYGLGRPPPIIGLLGAPAAPEPKNLALAVDPLSPEIRSHTVFRWLQSSPAFVRARRAFARRKLADDADGTEAIVEIRFLRDVLAWFSLTVSASTSGWKPKGPSAKQKRDATKHARALLTDLKHVSLNHYSDNDTLKRLLITLCEQLANAKRSYSGARALERQVLEQLSFSLLATHGLTSPLAVEIIESLAEVFGFNAAHRSVQRYVANAKAEHVQLTTRYLSEFATRN